MESLASWFPSSSQGWEIFFPFVGISNTWPGENGKDVSVPFNLNFPDRTVSFASRLKLERLYFSYICPDPYTIKFLLYWLTFLLCFLGDCEDDEDWLSLSQYSCCWWQGINICRNKQPKACQQTTCIPFHACTFSRHPGCGTWSVVTSRVLWIFWALLALREGVCTAK